MTEGGTFQAWRNVFRFLKLDAASREIVFFSEGAAGWVHLAPLVHALIETHRREICYLTSSPDDPGLGLGSELCSGFYIGQGVARTALFKALNLKVLVSTTPDLGGRVFQRSAHAAHYVYVHHSMVSTHMIYRQEAFDHFDTIFCVGPHHVDETRQAERLRDLPRKSLVAHGYGRLDQIRAFVGSPPEDGERSAVPQPESGCRVLVAPSWGEHGILETLGADLVRLLLDAGYVVTVRPHPETVKRSPEAIERVVAAGQAHPAFELERDVSMFDSLARADVMISDWSGAALEYAFGFERPVLYIDVPRKVLNPEYQLLRLEPLEVSIREQIGRVISSERLGEVPEAIAEMIRTREGWRETIADLRSRYVFNPGGSGRVGAECIVRIAEGSGAGHLAPGAPRSEQDSASDATELERVVSDLRSLEPISGDWSADAATFDSSAFIGHLAARPPPGVESPEFGCLGRLSRKVDITRTVCRTYVSTLDAPLDRQPVGAPVLALLAVLFVRQAQALIGEDRSARGPSLSFVNSAFHAIDAVRAELPVDMAGRVATLAESAMSEILS